MIVTVLYLGRLTQFGNFGESTLLSNVLAAYLNKLERLILGNAEEILFSVKYMGFDISVIFKLSRILF